MAAITEDQRKNYLSNNCSKCPYCGSDRLMGGSIDTEGGDEIWRKIECTSCNKSWVDVYRVVDISENFDGEE